MAIFDRFSVPKHVKPSDEGAEKLSDEGAGDAVASRDGSGDGLRGEGECGGCAPVVITWRATSACCWRVPSPSISHSVFARRMSSAAPSSCSASSKPSSSAILATSAASTGEGASASSAPGSTPEVGGRGAAGGGAAGGGSGGGDSRGGDGANIRLSTHALQRPSCRLSWFLEKAELGKRASHAEQCTSAGGSSLRASSCTSE
mmetsp:Transcript_28037/g.82448  ORF Transcript_28037/g.82448 Transcript_28037/m.82448 type:complete len:203 (-) Transcript_28037:224-832(-)